MLLTRMRDRYQEGDPIGLTPGEAHAFIEELLSRIARKEIAAAGDDVNEETLDHESEEVRERFSRRGAETRRNSEL
jgi:hypothetical protein